ncbi:hypothetical protein [Cellulomonas rhizosphaerae]|uniref:AbiEi antitoxin C-terminal domain-containing protein n=1 Tax=Cellulomonas rhizosphaerae TaxID=2293719 RepID=A0A413RM52_9CELL|nr:hypothetical protein [Cellulomonas rhizosphaerae]RHA41649.1 hypothetical protein D1825_08260 [Cellulomonas rhizosphaerae]
MTLAAYRPRPAVVPPLVVHRSAVPASAWHGQLRDGALRLVWGDVAVAADVVSTPELRALALAELVPARAVVGRGSALWVHAGRPEPERVEVLVGRRGRHTAPHPRRVSAEAELAPEDVVRVAGVRVTSVQRTGTDLARWLPSRDAVPLVAALVPLGFDPERALTDLGGLRGQRHVRTAQHTLALVGR